MIPPLRSCAIPARRLHGYGDQKMAPYDDWNKLDEDEDEELQDSSVRALPFDRIVAGQTHKQSTAVL